jgi:glycosyltransferase involved in cell wall biosynthesis
MDTIVHGPDTTMKVLLLNYEYPPFGGGASQATYFMARELAANDHRVDVLTSRVDGQPHVEDIDGVRQYRVRSWRRGVHQAGLLGAFSYVLFAFLELRKLLKKSEYDLAHFYFALPTGVLALFWRWRTGRPYVVSLRGSDVPGYDHTNRGLQLIHRIVMPLTRNILTHAQSVVANSRSLKDLAARSFPEIDISVITNGVDCNLFSPGSGKGHANGPVRALSVARLVSRKGLETMIEAMSLQAGDELRLDIVGDGPLASELRVRVERLGLGRKIRFLGPLVSKALRDAYRDADFFVLPSLTESFSMSLLEAMASGLPVVASEVGGIPELIVNGKNGILVEPGNAAELSAAMGEMAKSAEFRCEISARNRAMILAQYTWRDITARYMCSCYRWRSDYEVKTESSAPIDTT